MPGFTPKEKTIGIQFYLAVFGFLLGIFLAKMTS